jgi:hypothetical protein
MGATTTVAINPDLPYWQDNFPTNPGKSDDKSAVWISWGNTGYGGDQFQPRSESVPGVTIYDNFFLSGSGLLTLDVWADDTAEVFLDGQSIYSPVLVGQDICADKPIGCEIRDVAHISTAVTSSLNGSHQLAFAVYQLGTGLDPNSNPFGLLYTGTVQSAGIDPNSPSVPEPGTLGLAGIGVMVAAGVTLKRRRQRMASATN